MVFSFCNNTDSTTQQPEEKPTVTFAVDSLKLKSALCKNEELNKCVEVSVMYLVANSEDTSHVITAEKINQSIKDNLVAALNNQPGELNAKGDTEIKDGAEAFISNYESIAEQEEEMPSFEHSSDVTLLYDSPEMIAISFSHYDYTGGAHGNFYTNLINYDKKTGDIIKTDQILKDKEKISPFLEKAFRKKYDIKDGEDLNLSVEGNNIPVTDNIGILKDSLIFQYNPYEIGPYAMGAPTLKVAKADIKDFLH